RGTWLACPRSIARVIERALVAVAARSPRGERRMPQAPCDRIAGVAGAGIAVAAVEGAAEEADASAALLVAVADVAVRAGGAVGDRGLVAAEGGVATVRGADVGVVAASILRLAEDRAAVTAERVAVVARLRELLRAVAA